MLIRSLSDRMIATFPATDVRHEWRKGSHTVNIYQGVQEIDCYTFAWEKNTTTMLDFTTALLSHLQYQEV